MTVARISAEVLPMNGSKDENRLMETKNTRSNRQFSLVDVVLCAVGAKKVQKETLGEKTGERDDTSLTSDSDFSPMPMVDIIGDHARIPQIRTLRTVRRKDSDLSDSKSVLGTDGQTNKQILVPGLGSHLSLLRIIRCPFQEEEDSATDTCPELYTEYVPYSCEYRRRHFSVEQPFRVGHESEESESKVLGSNQESILRTPPATLTKSEDQATTTSAMSTPTTSTMSTSYHQDQSSYQQAQWADNTSRPRSRAIAIKNLDRCAEDLASSQNEATSERMYDWATWRMYNRIVDHRRNQRLSAPSYLPSPVDQPGSVYDQDMAFASNHLPSSDYVHDGEVFEFDI